MPTKEIKFTGDMAKAFGWDPDNLDAKQQKSLSAVRKQWITAHTEIASARTTRKQLSLAKAEDKRLLAMLEDLGYAPFNGTPERRLVELVWGSDKVDDDLLFALQWLTEFSPSATSSAQVEVAWPPDYGNVAVLSSKTSADPTATSTADYKYITPAHLFQGKMINEGTNVFDRLISMNQIRKPLRGVATACDPWPRPGDTLIVPIALSSDNSFAVVWTGSTLRSIMPDDMDRMSSALSVVACAYTDKAIHRRETGHGGPKWSYRNQSTFYEARASRATKLVNGLRLVQGLPTHVGPSTEEIA